MRQQAQDEKRLAREVEEVARVDEHVVLLQESENP
jgi:hypothetical protein